MAKRIGILTAGSDSPGLNAAIRAIGKGARATFAAELVGFQDGFQGLIENRTVPLEGHALSGILTTGGTILGTSRDRPHLMSGDGQLLDLSDQAVATYRKHKLDALVCIGGRETQESALHLAQKGLNVVTLPKAVDNDINQTDRTIGFETALEVAVQSIDRLHSTAHSNHRIIIVEVMGRHTGWLAVGAGIAGGADVILIPEIPYDIKLVSEAILNRSRAGRNFSIVVVSEWLASLDQVAFSRNLRQINARMRSGAERAEVEARLTQLESNRSDTTYHVSRQLEDMTGLETRITILGYLLRGGAPSAWDRMLATQLGSTCISAIAAGQFGVMISFKEGRFAAVPLEQVAGQHKYIPLDHSWIESARRVGTCLGD